MMTMPEPPLESVSTVPPIALAPIPKFAARDQPDACVPLFVA
jgi:hypothetical protein